MGKPFNNLTGKVFGKLTATNYLGTVPGKTKPYWLCICECGKQIQTTSSNLSSGHSKSCGCLLTNELKSRRIYDKNKSQEYGIWRGIKQRTTKSNSNNQRWYVGVALCDRWFNSFELFYKDMGPRPSTKHSIERLDLSKGYQPDNCVWASAKTQANNRTSNHVLEHEGLTLTIAQWSDRTGISQSTLLARVSRYNWSVEKALTTPTKNHAQH